MENAASRPPQGRADERAVRRWRKPVAVGLMMVAAVWLATLLALCVPLH